jgi:hypothetical protein
LHNKRDAQKKNSASRGKTTPTVQIKKIFSRRPRKSTKLLSHPYTTAS